jgi:ubiquinone/menaquinone biosynthesis C-methylase UbiE
MAIKNKSEIKSIAEWWEKFLKISSPLVSDWKEKEIDFMRKNAGGSVLDVGCGWGDDLESLAQNINEGVGIDNNRKVIKEAKKKLNYLKNIKLLIGNAENLSFKNNSFDFVICLGNTFGNLGQDKQKALREMKRVLKKDGKVIISVYSDKAFPERIRIYKKLDKLPILKIDNEKTVYVKGGIKSEQFSKEKLRKNFSQVGLKVKIKELNLISYICIATKK